MDREIKVSRYGQFQVVVPGSTKPTVTIRRPQVVRPTQTAGTGPLVTRDQTCCCPAPANVVR